jgi:predicted  nucleic acid-binding Zn-ribbon protein
MSDDSDAEGAGGRVVTVEADGVRVEKTFERDEFPVPVVSFVLTSSADEPVDVRLTDGVPESFAMEHVGFHPDFDSENWTAYRDHRVEYVCTLDPGDERRTVYGVRLDDERSTDEFLGEPSLERRDERADGDPEDILGRETNQVVRDALAGDEVPGVDGSLSAADEDVANALDADDTGEQEADGDDEATDGETLDLEPPQEEAADDETDDEPDGAEPDGAEGDEAEPDGAEGDDTDEDSESSDAPAPRAVDADLSPAAVRSDDEEAVDSALVESVAAALAAELRAGNVDDDDVETLREHLDAPAEEPSIPTSVDVRLRRIQSRVSELDAYTDALAEFLDENGTGEEIVEGFRADVAAVEDELGAMEDELRTLEADQAAVKEDLADVEAAVDDRTEALEAEIAELTGGVTEDVDSVRTDLDSVESDLGAVDEDVETLSVRLEELEAEVAEVEAAEAEELDSLASEVEKLRADVESFREFRERMRNAFGE